MKYVVTENYIELKGKTGGPAKTTVYFGGIIPGIYTIEIVSFSYQITPLSDYFRQRGMSFTPILQVKILLFLYCTD